MSVIVKNWTGPKAKSLGHTRHYLRISTCIALILLFAALIAPVSATIPVAEFTSNITKGIAPLAIQFNDSSTNNPDCWNWSFGDGTAWFNTTDGALKNTSYTYATKGWYNVTLIANNTDGSSRMIKTQYVNAATNGILSKNTGQL